MIIVAWDPIINLKKVFDKTQEIGRKENNPLPSKEDNWIIRDKISKEFYYLGRMYATGDVKEFIMPNTDKSAVEIEWALDTPVQEDIYEYIVNG